jgi:hypothetical protein
MPIAKIFEATTYLTSNGGWLLCQIISKMEEVYCWIRSGRSHWNITSNRTRQQSPIADMVFLPRHPHLLQVLRYLVRLLPPTHWIIFSVLLCHGGGVILVDQQQTLNSPDPNHDHPLRPRIPNQPLRTPSHADSSQLLPIADWSKVISIHDS